MIDQPDRDPFEDGIVTSDELRGDAPQQPFTCAACGLGIGDANETRCPACGADLAPPGALAPTTSD
ncbi:MAG: hypothetical protein ACR2HI_07555 [Gaiella sp.]